jgi:hypothetical protein
MADQLSNISSQIEQAIERARKALEVELDPNDSDLINQITLGDGWDDPAVLTKALDRQPLYYARWATLLRNLKKERSRLSTRYDAWMAIKKESLAAAILKENIESGMTASTGKPTGTAIDQRFISDYVALKKSNKDKHDEYLKYKKPIDSIEEKIDTAEIVVKAFEQRKDMLISLSSIVGKMTDSGLLIYRKKKKNSQNSSEDNEF